MFVWKVEENGMQNSFNVLAGIEATEEVHW
jgi:hypothetical protein